MSARDEGKGRLIGVVADVTELQEAHERDLAERSRLQRLLDSLSSFVGLMDPDGTLLEANAPALQAAGTTSGQVIGRKLWDTSWWSFNAESQNRLKEAIARVANGETVRYDVPVRMAEDQMITIDFQPVPIIDEDGIVGEIVPSGIDIIDRIRAEERKDILLAELEHRVKNTLATVQALARFSKRWATDKEDMARSLTDRLAAISRTHDAMTASDRDGEQLRTLLRNELSPYIDIESDRLRYAGDDLLLTPGNALPVGLAIHELATNAVKHGALTNDHGRIKVTVKSDGNELQRLEWREVDGPAVAQPEEEGFGMFLIGTLLEKELKASVTVDFHPSGVRCVILRD